MKILVLLAHPNIHQSRVNAIWSKELGEVENVTVHDLVEKYPTMDIDVMAEQELLLQHDRIIFMFPLFWYSSPAILKQWQDVVLQPTFAYGPGGDKLHNKEFMICTSVGSDKEYYRAGGYNNFTLDELLRPFQQMVNYIGGRYLVPYAVYRSIILSDQEILSSAKEVVAAITRDGWSQKTEHDNLVTTSLNAMFERVQKEA